MESLSTEILISASLVGSGTSLHYEFILDNQLQVLHCAKVASEERGILKKISNLDEELEGLLFELCHVRVNPKLDNHQMIQRLLTALNDIGVSIRNLPKEDSMAMCYKPLGEISHQVRFYLGRKRKIIFLSPAMRPKIIDPKVIPFIKSKKQK